MLRLFSLYISFDPDYSYGKTYLLDKISEFSHEMSGYYGKQQVIDNATHKWITEIPATQLPAITDIVITFDNVFQFKNPFNKLDFLKLPSLQEVRAKNIKIICKLEQLEIVDCKEIDFKNDSDVVIRDNVNTLNNFLIKTTQSKNYFERHQDEK